jgi:hypothetical protein
MGSPATRVPRRTIDVPIARRIDGPEVGNRRASFARRISSARRAWISHS